MNPVFRSVLVAMLSIAALSGSLSASAQAEGTASFPDYAPIQDLPEGTSIFLHSELPFPKADGREMDIPSAKGEGRNRVDFMVHTRRLAREKIPVGEPHCAIVAKPQFDGYKESIKEFQVSAIVPPVPAPRPGETGVGISLKSVQTSAILMISCYQSAESKRPIPLRTLREGVRARGDSVSLTVLPPPPIGSRYTVKREPAGLK